MQSKAELSLDPQPYCAACVVTAVAGLEMVLQQCASVPLWSLWILPSWH